MAAAMFRGRSLKSRRLRGRHESGEENVKLDYKKDPNENLKEILHNVVKQEGISKAKKLGYFNAFVRYCYRLGGINDTDFSSAQILCCLRLGLLHEAKEIRAACLRALRYYVLDPETLDVMVEQHIDYLIARSFDICLDNEIERIQAMRLMRKLMQICPDRYPRSLLHSMIAVANDGTKDHDKMVRACLATICELAFNNPKLVSECGGISVILHNVLDCDRLARVNESLLTPVLYMLNHPRTRIYIKRDIDLEQMLAPFTDSHFKLTAEAEKTHDSEDREQRFTASKMAIATIIKSWPGCIRLCKPDGTGLQSLLGVLYLQNMGPREDIMDILYDVFRLPMPEWTPFFTDACISVDPSEMRESWRLNEGFVVEEGKSILPHLAKTRPNLVENHMALILTAFINAGLLEALVEVIISSDDYVAVRAGILLGELLQMANTILPYEIGHHSHCLPTLVAQASSFTGSPQQRNRASLVINCLDNLHALKKQGPVPCSLYLSQLINHSQTTQEETLKTTLKPQKEQLRLIMEKQTDGDMVSQAIKDSGVLSTKDNVKWDWDLVGAILEWPDEALRRIEDQSNQRFVKRLYHYLKPTNKLYSVLALDHTLSRKITIASLHFMEYLTYCDAEEGQRYAEELLGDISLCLKEAQSPRPSHEALFSTNKLLSTCSQYYFLLLGKLTTTLRGEKLLETTGVYHSLLDMLTVSTHDTYIKLVVSSLDFSKEGLCRTILSKALTATSDSGRLYTTNYMRVLLRAKVPFFSSWGMEFLVMQLYDQSKSVAMEALSVISEACEDEVNLTSLVHMRPSVLHLGYKGAMLLARFLSIPQGYRYLTDTNYVAAELEKWHNSFNTKYVHVVEERLNEALTTYEKTYDGTYQRRSSRRQARHDVYVPIHLYGQLVQHKAGFDLLEQQPYLSDYFETVQTHNLHTDDEVLTTKAALWVVGHIGTSVWGIGYLQQQCIIPEVIKLAEECGVLSVRGTAYFVLGLIASTSKGANILNDYGWECVRHKRTDLWPVIKDDSEVEEVEADVGLPSSPSNVSLGSRQSDMLILPAVTIQPSSSQASPKSNRSSSPKPKNNFTVGDADEGHVIHVSLESSRDSSRSPSPSPASDTPVKRETLLLGSVKEETVLETEVVVETIETVVQSAPPIDAIVNEVELLNNGVGGLDIVENKERSPSAPTDYKPTLIHPRTCSDPVSNGNQAMVHFKDPDSELDEIQQKTIEDVYRKTQRKRFGSGMGSESSRSDYNSLKSRSTSFGEEKSASQDSARSNVTDRTNSFNTDTSGVYGSSGDSIHRQNLSPIPSASSVATNNSRVSFEGEGHNIHPSDKLRRLANLRKVPSTKRRYSNPVFSRLSKTLPNQEQLNEFVVSYTSSRDVQGYATLREIQKQRRMSVEMNEDINVTCKAILEEPRSVTKAKTLGDITLRRVGRNLQSSFRKPKFRFSEKIPCTRAPRDLASTSLQDLSGDRPPRPLDFLKNPSTSTLPSLLQTAKKVKSGSTGKAEYIGICLPVDINMIFSVDDMDCDRSNVTMETEPSLPHPRETETYKSFKLLRSTSEVEEAEGGLEFHTPEICLGCYKIRRGKGSGAVNNDSDDETFFPVPANSNLLTISEVSSRDPSPIPPGAVTKTRRSHTSMSEVGGSVSSIASVESTCNAKASMSEDSLAGRILIRKEILKFVVNLSSSIGTKTSEQGLLVLKQKFAKSFQDVCLYSEICYLLANYNFRLSTRRFIQELFQDATFIQMYEEPRELLDIGPETTVTPTEIDNRLERVFESMA